MARAGFWSIGGYEISFRKDGRWYADEEPIENARIALLFSRHIRAGEDGGWVVDVGVDRQPVTVEDTALVVVAADGDRRRGFRIKTNDGIEERLDPATLRIGRDNVLYCDVDRGERGVITARFLRPAYYALAAEVEQDADGPVLACCGSRYPIRSDAS